MGLENGNGKAPTRIEAGAGPAGADPLGPARSGRRFVLRATIGLAITWLGLYLSFSGWRASYRRRIARAKAALGPVVDPLIGVRPPEMPEGEWRTTVERTRGMLLMLAGADRLDLSGVEALRRDLAARVASS